MKVNRKIEQMRLWVFESKRRTTAAFAALIILVYIPIFVINTLNHIELKPRSGSAKHLFLLGYHLQHHKIFSQDFKDSENVSPSFYRPPGYPAFLAMCIAVIPDFRNISINDLTSYNERGKKVIDERKNRGFIYIKYCEAFLHLLISFMSMWLAWRITKKRYIAVLILVFVGFHPRLSSSVNSLHTEIFTSFLVTLFSISILATIEKKHYLLFALSGLLLGCITLTRATWYYYLIPGLLFFIYYAWCFQNNKRRIFFGSIIFTVCFALIVGVWMARNYYHFNRACIAGRGGHVLDIRMNHNMMNWKEYKASFLLWSNNKYLKQTLLNKFFKPEEWAQLDRNNSDGFYRTARKRGSELRKQYGAQIGDKMQFKEAVKKFFHHPVRHIFTTIPFTYRGIQKFSRQEAINVLIIILSAIALTSSVLIKNTRAVAVLFPVGIMFMFNCFCTHNLARYNLPYIPIFLIAAFLGIEYIWIWCKQKSERRYS